MRLKNLAGLALVLGLAACSRKNANGYVPNVEVYDVRSSGGRLAQSFHCRQDGGVVDKLWKEHASAFGEANWFDFDPKDEYRFIILNRDSAHRIVLKSRHPYTLSSLAQDPASVRRRAAFDAIASACRRGQRSDDSRRRTLNLWPWLFPLLAAAGLALGFVPRPWEDAATAAAFPTAVRLSRWTGLLVATYLFARGLDWLNPESQASAFVAIGGLFWLPIMGVASCWCARPVIYLVSFQYYRWANKSSS